MDNLYIGLDWSEAKHDVCMMNETGATVKEFSIPQTAQGHQRLEQEIKGFNVAAEHCLVGLETSSNLVMDFLEPRPYTPYVIAPNQVASSRGRFTSSGRRNDRSDAHLLADMLRTDRHRFTPWRADGVSVNQMRTTLRLIDDLTQSITRYSNRLRAGLLRAYPLAVSLFSDLTTQIALQFLIEYPSQALAQAITYEAFAAFCRRQGYSHPHMMPQRYAHLQEDVPQPAPTSLPVPVHRTVPSRAPWPRRCSCFGVSVFCDFGFPLRRTAFLWSATEKQPYGTTCARIALKSRRKILSKLSL